MWLRLAELCEARHIARLSEGAESEARAASIRMGRCYWQMLRIRPVGHLLMLEKIARSNQETASILLKQLKEWCKVPWLTCDVAQLREAHPLLIELARAKAPEIFVPALQMLDQAMPFGAGNELLAAWVMPLAREHLNSANVNLTFCEARGNMMYPYLAAEERGALLVSIATQLAPSTNGHAELALATLEHCKPHLTHPQFGNQVSDYAWKLTEQIAASLDSEKRNALTEIVTAHQNPGNSSRAVTLIKRMLAALRASPFPPLKRPDLTATNQSAHATLAAFHPVMVEASLRRLEQARRMRTAQQFALVRASRSIALNQQIRALTRATTVTNWTALLEREVLYRTNSHDADVRIAAYTALRARDPDKCSSAWLIHEMAFDPDIGVRKLYWRWNR